MHHPKLVQYKKINLITQYHAIPDIDHVRFYPRASGELVGEIFDWRKITINHNFISEIEEHIENICYVAIEEYDYFNFFIKGKRLLLTERILSDNNKNIYIYEGRTGMTRFRKLKLDLSKVIMSNGNEHYVLRV